MGLPQLHILVVTEMKALGTTTKSGVNRTPDRLMLLFLNSLLTRTEAPVLCI